MQWLERLKMTTATNQNFEKSLLVFQKFRTSIVIIPKLGDTYLKELNYLYTIIYNPITY